MWLVENQRIMLSICPVHSSHSTPNASEGCSFQAGTVGLCGVKTEANTRANSNTVLRCRGLQTKFDHFTSLKAATNVLACFSNTDPRVLISNIVTEGGRSYPGSECVHLEHGKKVGKAIPVRRVPLPIMKRSFRNVVHDKPNLRAPFEVLLSMQWCFFCWCQIIFVKYLL